MKKNNLEETVKEECPFLKTKTSMFHGIFLLAGGDEITYKCSIGGKLQGKERTSMPGGVGIPCYMEYAETCESYQNKMSQTR